MDDNNKNYYSEENNNTSGMYDASSHRNEEPYGSDNGGNGYKTYTSYGNGFGIASLVTGIIALVGLCMCLGPVSGILAIVFGAIQISRTPENKTFSIVGIVTGALGILLSLAIIGILVWGISVGDATDIQEIYNQIGIYDI